MKHNKRIFLLILSLTLVFSILFTAVASARNVSGASVGDEEIDRGVAILGNLTKEMILPTIM